MGRNALHLYTFARNKHGLSGVKRNVICLLGLFFAGVVVTSARQPVDFVERSVLPANCSVASAEQSVDSTERSVDFVEQSMVPANCSVDSSNCSVDSVEQSVASADRDVELPEPYGVEEADSVVHRMIEASGKYARIVDEYFGNVYLKGRFKVHRKNHLIKVVPAMFRLEKGVRDYLMESDNEIHYTAPDIYDLKVKARTGTFRGNQGQVGDIMEFLRMNIYSPYLLPEQLLSPLSRTGMKWYRYLCESVTGAGDSLRYKILILPRNKSEQLVSGYMVVNHGSWTIDELRVTGKVEHVRFSAKVLMGKEGNALYLPRRFEANMLFSFVGNKVEADYQAVFNYETVFLADEARRNVPRRDKYNLSDAFNLRTDSATALSDTLYMNAHRALPLTALERQVYADYRLRADTMLHSRRKKSRGAAFFGSLGDALISNYTVNMADYGSVKCSPLINPLLFGYSHSNGYSYAQKFKYSYLFPDQRLLRITPRVGYNFTDKEFRWRLDADFVYWPERMGQVQVRMGNGNRIYSSDVLDDLKNMPDTAIHFDRMELDYFKDDYLTLSHKVEVANGLSLEVGAAYHRRTLVNERAPYNPDLQTQLSGRLRNLYVSFAPRVRIEWTPHLYYYMNGRRKMNLRSRYPTFSLDWERGVRGVFGSKGRYERLEFDMQQMSKFGGSYNLFYRLGCGAFTDQKEMYFVDFANFSRNNLPTGWNDEIGGAFHLLDRRWYNSSNKYVRGHVTYESPFLVLRHLVKFTSIIRYERLYGSALYVPHLLPYLELGYGIGTHIFDLGVFVSSVNGGFQSVGCKFAFELFND